MEIITTAATIYVYGFYLGLGIAGIFALLWLTGWIMDAKDIRRTRIDGAANRQRMEAAGAAYRAKFNVKPTPLAARWTPKPEDADPTRFFLG